MTNIRNFTQKIVPDAIDVGYAVLLSAILMLLGNLAKLLDSFNVPGSRELLQSNTGHAITSFLAKIDDFSFTKTGVLFLFWSFVGLCVYFIIQTMLAATSEVQYEREIASNQYIHPAGFDRAMYQKQVVTNHIVKFLLTLVFIIFLVLTLALALPFANSKLAYFIESLDISSGTLAVLGLALLATMLVALFTAFRATRQYRALIG